MTSQNGFILPYVPVCEMVISTDMLERRYEPRPKQTTTMTEALRVDGIMLSQIVRPLCVNRIASLLEITSGLPLDLIVKNA